MTASKDAGIIPRIEARAENGVTQTKAATVYDTVILTWSDQQADLLRRLAAGERVNDQVDWANVIEEVQDVGISILKSCRSQLRTAILHRLKTMAWPDTSYVAHWESEATAASTPSPTGKGASRIESLSVESSLMRRCVPRVFCQSITAVCSPRVRRSRSSA